LHEEMQAPVILVEEVEPKRVHLYGIIDGEEVRPGVYRIRDFIEKPKADEAPSNLAIAGRYLLTADIFDLIGETRPDGGGEVQLTDALRALVRKRPMYGLKLNGRRCDIGNKDGFIRTNIEFALKREDMAEDLRQYLKDLAKTL
jgi:UTP--glucose-1-phosphate uridylyltransferase